MPGEQILVGVSGGADSICLLHLLQKTNNPVVVAHFNHHLRKEAEKDLYFVQGITHSLGLRFIQGERDVKTYSMKHHKTLEEAARICRYEFLFEQARDQKINVVAVAHTASDQAETILMHILRGCGLDGLQGMLPVTVMKPYPSIKLIRPLLTFWKEEVLSYCCQNGLTYVSDFTNNDPNFFRNRLRLKLIPTLREYNPCVEKHLNNLGKIAIQDLKLINQQVVSEYDQCRIEETQSYISLSLMQILKIPDGLKARVMQHAFRKISHSSIELGFDLVNKMVAFIQKTNSKSHLPIVSDFELTLENDFLFLHQKGAVLSLQNYPCMDPNLLIQLKFPGAGQINKVWSIKADLVTKKNLCFPPSSGQLIYQTFIDVVKITNPLILKCQKPGDRFSPLGLKGKEQKLSDFWINKKIPRRFRSTWPLLFDEDKIAWIPGFQPSHYFQITEGSIKILKIELIRNRD